MIPPDQAQRWIVLDTETTGLEPALGHRVIELGAVEVVNRQLTGKHWHTYFDPERDIDAGAMAVHGISIESLAGKPKFAERVDDLLAFLQGAQIIIHNAAFDVAFLNAELARCDRGGFETKVGPIVDSLKLARETFPGKRNNLDALCERLGVDHRSRTLHGALLDAQLLADVYLALTRGQGSISLNLDQDAVGTESEPLVHAPIRLRPANTDEQAAHAAYLDAMRAKGGKALWGA